MKSYAAAVLGAALSLMAAGAAHSADPKAMNHQSMPKQDKSLRTHQAVGVVKQVDAKAGTVSLAHEPVKSLEWPAMTMTFKVQDKTLLDKIAVGSKIAFEFEQRGKDYVIVRLSKS